MIMSVFFRLDRRLILTKLLLPSCRLTMPQAEYNLQNIYQNVIILHVFLPTYTTHSPMEVKKSSTHTSMTIRLKYNC